jgi:hypothetical protein
MVAFHIRHVRNEARNDACNDGVKLRSEYQGNGLETILMLHAKRDIYAVEHGDAFEAMYDEIIQEGITDFTNESYLDHASNGYLSRTHLRIPIPLWSPPPQCLRAAE